MDCPKPFFVEGSSGSEDELGFSLRDHQQQKKKSNSGPQRTPSWTTGDSLPLVLAFPLPTGRAHKHSPSSSSSDQDQEELESGGDEPIEEWMIVGGEDQEGDQHIQLNLGYWHSSSSEDDSESQDQKPKSLDHPWAVLAKDKSHHIQKGTDQLLRCCFKKADRLHCQKCNKTGHLAKSCPSHKKRRTCVLCGTHGHTQKHCPGRHCNSCGLPPHRPRPCPQPSLWKQHCRRCGVRGHLSDVCPDTWRQYHKTTQVGALKPVAAHTLKQTKRQAQCYNCSKGGHYGYECTKQRMVSGTFPSLPYICHYDTEGDIVHQRHTRLQSTARECQQSSEQARDSDEKNQPAQGKSGVAPNSGPWGNSGHKKKCQDGRRKTQLERRRERREIKRLRREAQARREGGLLGCSRACSDDDETYPSDSLKVPTQDGWQFTPPPCKKVRMNKEKGGGKSRKSREAERWKKRRGMKHGYLRPHSDLGATDGSLLSPKHRLRHHRKYQN